jgi:hypothetical protein
MFAAGALALLIPAAASAQTFSPTTFYGNVGYAGTSVEEVDLGAIQGRLGARFGRFIGVEGEVSFGVQDDTVTEQNVDVDIGLNHAEGIYLVGFAPLSPEFDLLARVGYSNAEISGESGNVNIDVSDSGIAYGVGAQYHFDGRNGVRFDYTRHDFDDIGDADVWSVAYSRRF